MRLNEMTDYTANLDNAEAIKKACKVLSSAVNNPFSYQADQELPGDKITFEEYNAALAYVKNLLLEDGKDGSFAPEEVENARVAMIANDSKLKTTIPSGARLCLVPFPCNYNGLKLDDKQIVHYEFLQFLLVDKAGNTLRGFGAGTSQIFRSLPKEIRDALLVQVGQYEMNENPFLVTAKDREMVAASLHEAFRKVRELFS